MDSLKAWGAGLVITVDCGGGTDYGADVRRVHDVFKDCDTTGVFAEFSDV